jgi:hypothetical protein
MKKIRVYRWLNPKFPEYQYYPRDEELMKMMGETHKILNEIERITNDFYYNSWYYSKKKNVGEKWELEMKIKELRQKFIVQNMHFLFGY